MKREIKFRGKPLENGNWVYGDLVHSFEGVHIVESSYFKPSNDQSPELIEVHPETVGQYTGLKDVVGNEIYEGDAVHSDDHQPPRYAIEFIEGGVCATNELIKGYPIDINHFYPSIGCAIKVIGNIHDNPELIK